jgi:hypothetical protein
MKKKIMNKEENDFHQLLKLEFIIKIELLICEAEKILFFYHEP